MEIDSNCLFSDTGNCSAVETPCLSFYTPPATTDNHLSLLGCKTKLEIPLLQHGNIDMISCNVAEFNVCHKHSSLIHSSLFKNCCLCKSFGRVKSSKSGLRTVSKLYALAAWKKSQIHLTFGRKMCTQCRNDLDKFYINEELKKECDALFQWLYDVNIVHTPSICSSDSCNILSQSFNDLVVEEKQEQLKQFLQGNLSKCKF